MIPDDKKKPGPVKRGPEPARLKIDGDIGDALHRILNAGKPADKMQRTTKKKRKKS